MFIERGALQLRQVKAHRRSRVLVLAEQVMAGEVVSREGDEFGWGLCAGAGEDLRVDMAGELLYANFAEAGFRGDFCLQC
jgi:hypothetical protein